MGFKIDDKVVYTGKYSSFIVCNAVGVIVSRGIFGWNVKFLDNLVWFCTEENLVKILLKNEQLLFEFMR